MPSDDLVAIGASTGFTSILSTMVPTRHSVPGMSASSAALSATSMAEANLWGLMRRVHCIVTLNCASCIVANSVRALLTNGME